MLAIFYLVNSICPLGLLFFSSLTKFIKIFFCCFFMARFCISSSLTHNLCEHFIGRLQTRTESIRIHFCF